MRIGIPKAMLYYKYNELWKTFFTEIGCEVILSKDTNKKILDDGVILSVDECCLPSKIYLGHVASLIGKCDYIFVPRFCSFKDNDVTCSKFNALYDICYNTFDDIKLLTYNVDYYKGAKEITGFIDIGKQLGISYIKILKAYLKALKSQKKQYIQKVEKQQLFIEESCKSDKLNILVVSHPYIVYDKLLGNPITSYLNKLDSNIIYADVVEEKEIKDGWKKFTKTMYWKDNKLLLSGLKSYLKYIDGVIFLSVFTCGPDSLATEMCMRKVKEVPCLNIVLDELNSDTGMHTRLESFTDVLNDKKRVLIYG